MISTYSIAKVISDATGRSVAQCVTELIEPTAKRLGLKWELAENDHTDADEEPGWVDMLWFDDDADLICLEILS